LQKNTFQAKSSVEVYSVHLRGAFGKEIIIDKLTSTMLNPLLLPTDAHNLKKRRCFNNSAFFNVMCISW